MKMQSETLPQVLPGPLQEDKEAMIAGVRAVNTSRADLGIVVDTDVDRSAVVAGNGTPINSNRYIALMSYITLRSAQVAQYACSHPCSAFAGVVADRALCRGGVTAS